MKITAVILTKNEQKNIERCLKSLDFCGEIMIVDDYSEDKTLEIVHKVLKVHKVYKVFKRKLNGDFAGQRNFAMDRAKNEWVLFLDADEEVTEELKKEIVILLNGYIAENTSGFYIRRRDYFWDREMKYGETAKIRNQGLLRLVRKDAGKWEGKVHEEFKVKSPKSKVQSLANFVNHYPHQSVKEFLEEINFYSTLRAKELLELGRSSNIFEIVFFPLGKFLLTYFLKLGFLDGPRGFVYAFFMSFHSFLVRSKLFQYTKINKMSA